MHSKKQNPSTTNVSSSGELNFSTEWLSFRQGQHRWKMYVCTYQCRGRGHREYLEDNLASHTHPSMLAPNPGERGWPRSCQVSSSTVFAPKLSNSFVAPISSDDSKKRGGECVLCKTVNNVRLYKCKM